MKLWGWGSCRNRTRGELSRGLCQAIAGQAVVILKMGPSKFGVSCDSGCLTQRGYIESLAFPLERGSRSSRRCRRFGPKSGDFLLKRATIPHTRYRFVSSRHLNHPWRDSPASPNCGPTGQSKRPWYPRSRPRPRPRWVSGLPRQPLLRGE